jgi:hypothetical protein
MTNLPIRNFPPIRIQYKYEKAVAIVLTFYMMITWPDFHQPALLKKQSK